MTTRASNRSLGPHSRTSDDKFDGAAVRSSTDITSRHPSSGGQADGASTDSRVRCRWSVASKSMISAGRAQSFLALRAGAASRRPTPTPLPSGGAAGGGPTPTPLPIPRACHPTLPGSQLESCDEASLTTAVEHRTPALAPWQIFFRTSKMETDPLCPPSPHLSSPPICVDMLNSETPTYESPVVYRTCT